MTDVSIILFDGFEPLDMAGPVEVFGDIGEWRLRYFSEHGGPVSCRQGFKVITEPFSAMTPADGILFVPGGMGSRPLSLCTDWLHSLAQFAGESRWVLSVCTGSVLLAAAGVLDGRKATSNKRSWSWVTSFGSSVRWQPQARWTADGKFRTSSGVSAGTDMALAFVGELFGEARAESIARRMEYIRSRSAEDDPFAVR